MKLVEVLAKELDKWPAGVHVFGCDIDGEIRAYDKNHEADSVQCMNDFFPETQVDAIDRANGFGSEISPIFVTREMWKAERAKMKPKKAGKDGWIRHRGGKCPVEVSDELCEMIESADSAQNEALKALLSRKSQFVDGPIQWRDRITELDANRAEIDAEYKRQTAEIDQERESLVAKLAAEGFALIEPIGVQMEDMSDPANWKAGDHIEIIKEVYGHAFDIGEIVVIEGIGAPEATDDANIKCWHTDRSDFWYVSSDEAKWHSRPNQ